MADSKLLLRQARQLIDENKHEEAQGYCIEVLLTKQEHYLALVILGKSLQGSVKALSAYKRAIVQKPYKPLAWQGIASFYETFVNRANENDLLITYREILELKIPKNRILEIIRTVAEIGHRRNNMKCMDVFLTCLRENPKNQIFAIAKRELLKLVKAALESDVKILPFDNSVSQEVYYKVLQNSIGYQLGKILLAKGDFVEGFKEVIELPFFRSSFSLRNYVCTDLCNRFVIDEKLSGIEICHYVHILTEDIEDWKYPALLLTMVLFRDGFFQEAYEQSKKFIDTNNPTPFEVIYKLKCEHSLKMWFDVETLAKSYLNQTSDDVILLKLKKFLIAAYAGQKKWNQAVAIATDIPFNSFELSELVTLGNCIIENADNPNDILTYIQPISPMHYTQLRALVFLKQENYVEVLNTLDNDHIDSVNFLYIAKAFWHMKEFDMSYLYIIRSIKHSPQYADAYFFLGTYYEQHEDNKQKSIFYYEKALESNKCDVATIKAISNIYKEKGLRQENVRLLTDNYKYLEGHSWVNFQIGINHFDRENWQAAIEQFLKAISYNDKEVKYYEYLAESYFRGGFSRRALEAYKNLVALHPKKKSTWLNKIGEIHIQLKEYDDALAAYRQIFQSQPKNVTALKGVTETWLEIAQQHYTKTQYHTARWAAQTSIEFLIYIISNKRNYLCFWKILADAIIFIAQLPEAFSFVVIKFDEEADLGELGTIRIKTNMYKFAYFCMWRSRSLLPPDLDKKIAREIFNDIAKGEEPVDPFITSCALEMGQQEWFNNILKFRRKFAIVNMESVTADDNDDVASN